MTLSSSILAPTMHFGSVVDTVESVVASVPASREHAWMHPARPHGH